MNEKTEIVQDKKTSEKLSTKERRPLGNYLITGGPGRPKGLENKFTKAKAAFLKAVVTDGTFFKRIEQIAATGSNAEVLELARIMATLWPKEIRAQIEGDGSPTIVFQFTKNEPGNNVIEVEAEKINANGHLVGTKEEKNNSK